MLVFSIISLVLAQLIAGQTTGGVGANTTQICNVLSYGATANMSSDLGPYLLMAWADCSVGGTG